MVTLEPNGVVSLKARAALAPVAKGGLETGWSIKTRIIRRPFSKAGSKLNSSKPKGPRALGATETILSNKSWSSFADKVGGFLGAFGRAFWLEAIFLVLIKKESGLKAHFLNKRD
jgi:hypothetical protein